MGDALQTILSHKSAIDERLITYLAGKKVKLAQLNSWGGDVIDRLIPFTTSGKTTRGSLAVYTYSLFQKNLSSKIYTAAAALELFHSGFLIHDDVMDKDRLRRGKPSIWEQYRRTSQSRHIGISQAINVGDICFFLAQELLSETGLLSLVSNELSHVVIAQMQDVESGNVASLSKNDIMSLYRYKTARYTFSLSMAVGATLAGTATINIELLERLGESMGLLYQIRDDELSIKGNSAITGKPVGSDERNAKQTLATLLNGEELNDVKASLLEHCDHEIDALPIAASHKEELTSLVRFCLNRNK